MDLGAASPRPGMSAADRVGTAAPRRAVEVRLAGNLALDRRRPAPGSNATGVFERIQHSELVVQVGNEDTQEAERDLSIGVAAALASHCSS